MSRGRSAAFRRFFDYNSSNPQAELGPGVDCKGGRPLPNLAGEQRSQGWAAFPAEVVGVLLLSSNQSRSPLATEQQPTSQ
jgi:hypothetical protein